MKAFPRIVQAGPVVEFHTGQQMAVWPGDEVRVIRKIGSRRLCRVTFYHGTGFTSFTAVIPKRWMRWRVYRPPAP